MSARVIPIGAVATAPAQYLRVVPRPRVVRIALAGCGVVGGSLVRLVRERGAEIEATRGLRLEIARILVRDRSRPRDAAVTPSLLTTDPDELLAARTDVLVEAIGGLDPAERLARETLARGASVVTANKELVAAAGAELAALAEETGATFDFEASVAGGVPVIRALRGALAESDIVSVSGTLNGTTNFLLGKLIEGAAYADALAEAQAKGFAEADPARDVDGRDAAAKLAVLAWLAFGVDPSTLRIRRRGLLPDPDLLASAAVAFGGVPRLVGEAVRRPNGVVASVEPAVVAADSELAAVRGEHNLVQVESRWNGRIRLAGPGAGGMPTASALLSDVLGTAGPLRARPPAPASSAPAEDDRPLPWIVAVRAGARVTPPRNGQRAEPAGADDASVALARALRDAGVPAPDGRLTRDLAAARTAPVPWERVAAASAALQREGYQPVVLRDERGG